MTAALGRFLLVAIVLAAGVYLRLRQRGGCQAAERLHVAGDGPGEKGPGPWLDFDDGLARARSTKKPIMVNFYTDCAYTVRTRPRDSPRSGSGRTVESGFIAIRLNAENGKARLSYRGKSFSHANSVAISELRVPFYRF